MPDVDITQDLVDGSFDQGSTHIPNAGTGTELQTPPGAVPAHGAGTSVPEAAPAKVEGTPAATDSIRDALTKAFKADEKPADASVQGQQPGAVVPPAQAAPAAVPLTKGEDGKYRTSDGKFASQEQITAFETAQTAGTAAQAPSYMEGMTPLEQQQFQSLPAELQQYVGRTMEGLASQRATFQEYGLIEQVVGPRRQAWASNGLSPALAIQNLLNLSDFASRDPGQFCLWLADQNNVDLDALLDARDAANAANANLPPEMRDLQGQVQSLQQQLAGFTGQQQHAQHQMNVEAVQAFAAEKDTGGNLVRPYFADVANDIITLMPSVRAQNPNVHPQELLKRAYDAACYANPSVRQRMQEADNAARAAEQAAAAERARHAGSSVNGGPTGDAGRVPDNANRSIRDELVAQFAAYSN